MDKFTKRKKHGAARKVVAMNKKNIFITSSLFLFSIIVCLIDAVVQPKYLIKISIKICFFLLLPMIFFLVNKEARSDFKQLFRFRKKGFLKALLLGVSVFAVILGGYFLTRNVIDFSNVTKSLTEGMGITADNFIYVFVYIAVVNSFLEEFFFRGYGFITLKKYTNRKFAYVFSSCVFAVYHVGMLLEMFHIGILFLLLLGLIVGGCIFNFLNESTNNVYPSWFVHMSANLAINTIGLILFGMI